MFKDFIYVETQITNDKHIVMLEHAIKMVSKT